MFTQLETRNIARQLYKEFLPQIVYDHHQAPPFPARIFIPPFAEPSNDHIPTLVIEGVDKIGQAIKHRLAHEKKSGAISRIDFNTWWNGGMRTAPYFHNMIGILTETAHASATPTNHNPITFPKYFRCSPQKFSKKIFGFRKKCCHFKSDPTPRPFREIRKKDVPSDGVLKTKNLQNK